VLSGYPHLEEAYRFAELVFPLLELDHDFSSNQPGRKLSGPFGEIVANHFVPKAPGLRHALEEQKEPA